jgi:hypothetical protein
MATIRSVFNFAIHFFGGSRLLECCFLKTTLGSTQKIGPLFEKRSHYQPAGALQKIFQDIM